MSKPLDHAALELLKDLCACEDGKGLIVGSEIKKAASSLVRRGLAWTLSGLFTVVIATDAGKKHVADLMRQAA